jgi:capsid protein
VRGGLISLQEVHRQNGYDSDKVFEEIEADNKRIDEKGFIFDSDARKTMKAGVTQAFLKTPSDAAEFKDPEPDTPANPPAV